MNHERIKSYVNEAFPEAKLMKCSSFKTGLSSSRVFKLKIKKTTKNLTLVLKIFPGEYSGRIRKEVKILKYLKKHKVPSPTVLYVTYNASKNQGFLIEEYINGKTLFEKIKERNLNPKMITSAAKSLVKIHGLPKSQTWQDPLQRIETREDWINSVIKRNKSNLRDALKLKVINNDEYKKIEQYFDLFVEKLNKSRIYLCPIHGDYNPQNISLNSSGAVNAIFDFEIHRIAHNINELGIVYYWFKFYNRPNLFTPFLKEYSKVIKLNRTQQGLIQGYYLMQVIGALSFLLRNNGDKKAVNRLKDMLNELMKQISKQE